VTTFRIPADLTISSNETRRPSELLPKAGGLTGETSRV